MKLCTPACWLSLWLSPFLSLSLCVSYTLKLLGLAEPSYNIYSFHFQDSKREGNNTESSGWLDNLQSVGRTRAKFFYNRHARKKCLFNCIPVCEQMRGSLVYVFECVWMHSTLMTCGCLGTCFQVLLFQVVNAYL